MNINCDINFNVNYLYPNQDLMGFITLEAEEKCIIAHVIVEVIGTAECQWTNDKHLIKFFRVYKKGTTFHGKRDFFFSRHTVAGETSVFTLTAEPQHYSFKAFIPEYLPATWEGEHGTIKYVTKVHVKKINELYRTFEKEIVVYPHRNISLERHLLSEVYQTVKRTFQYAVLNLGTVHVNIWLPLCGIAAGQSIPILCTINNQSKIFFGGLIFVLTQIQVYRSTQPTIAAKMFRKDVCRVPRIVDILEGKYEFYSVLQTDPNMPPTNQYSRCDCCQVIYEVWISVEGSVPRYKAYGYPNIDTPGLPVIIGTHSFYYWDIDYITNKVMADVFEVRPSIEMDALPPDDEVVEILNNPDEEFDKETEWNIVRQLVDATLYTNKEGMLTENKINKTS